MFSNANIYTYSTWDACKNKFLIEKLKHDFQMNNFTIDYHTKCSLTGLSFEYLNKSGIRKISVKEIKSPFALDRLLNPVPNGLYDLALGPLDKNDVCLTCHLDYFKCPGHFGHIDLALPVYNPIFFKDLVKLLRAACLSCHKLLASPLDKDYFYACMRLLDHNLLDKLPLIENQYDKIVYSAGNETRLIESGSYKSEFHELVERLIAYENENNSNDLDHSANRNVLKAKIDLIKDLFSTKLKANRQTCPNCGLPLRQLRAELNSKLFYSKGVSTRQLKKNRDNSINGAKKKGAAETIELNDDEDEASRVPDDLEKDLGGTVVDEDEKEEDEETRLKSLSGQTYLTPVEVRKHLRELIDNERDILLYLVGQTVERTKELTDEQDVSEVFFFETIAVAPSRFRPISQMKDQKFENAQTTQLSKLIQFNVILKETLAEILADSEPTSENITEEVIDSNMVDKIISKNSGKKQKSSQIEKLQNAWLQVQQAVNVLYDADLDKLNRDRVPNGLKQVLEKKEGLFRKHMMGKRVNFAGRSVISPDVYIGTDEIGIPEVFAKKLTYPQPVNAFNYFEMRQAVLNGPDVHPGATLVEYGNGSIVRLRASDPQAREAIAKQLLTPESSVEPNLDIKIVHRHLRDGDVLLFNRQPTLHRPSIMAHKARVLPKEKTLRMHYSNCKAYNADFDGDEMNCHLPQNELARAEALNIMLSSEHYLVPKDGTPLGGLIHDHVVGGTALTCRDRFFDRADYQELVYQALHHSLVPNVKLLPPAIIKPKALWTGKQVVSTLFLNLFPIEEKGGLNLEGKAKVPTKSWNNVEKSNGSTYTCKNDELLNDSHVIIRDGQLLSGVLDKAHYGSSSYSLVHCCYELYGGSLAGELLTCLGRLFTAFIQRRGFTLGVEDILLRPTVRRPMHKIQKRVRKCGFECLAKVCHTSSETSGEELVDQLRKMHLDPDESHMREIDLAYKGAVDTFQNDLTHACFPNGLVKRFPDNNLQLMIQSGAKGSSVNSMQMSCLLGQQELEGRRPRLMVNGNTLPSFLPYDPSPTSGGFIVNSFMTGLVPQEYFFHCMAGREGLVDTAVKTSRSGYLQRCLIKHLEGLVVNYDLTVRDSDSSLIQFQYGEDSLAIEKTPFLNEKHFPFLAANRRIIKSNQDECSQINSTCKSKKVAKEAEKVNEWKREVEKRETEWKKSNSDQRYRWGPFVDLSKKLVAEEKSISKASFADRIQLINETWKSLDDHDKHVLKKKCPARCRLPLTATYSPDRYLGAISERMERAMENYMKKNDVTRLFGDEFTPDDFKQLIHLKSLKSCVTPGDSVGILAAQSIGEPSTQMTLNTFHFAGRGDMNVTLGIPRLREILMVASAQIKTPSMQVPVRVDQVPAAERLKSHFTRTLFWECLNRCEIEQTLELKEGEERAWLTSVTLQLIPQHELTYALSSPLSLTDLLAYVETKFVKTLCVAITKKYNQIASSSLLHSSTVRDKSMKNFKNINQSEGGEEGGGEDKNEDEDDDDVDEVVKDTGGESMGEKMKRKLNDEQEYDEDEEDESSSVDEDDEEVNDESVNNPITAEDEDDDDIEMKPAIDNDETPTKKKHSKKMNKVRVKRVLGISDLIASYSYDAEDSRWCKIVFKLDAHKPRLDLYTVIQKEAKHSYISKVSGIKRCFLNQSTLPQDNGCFKLITEGINVDEVIKNFNILDASKLYLNDIHLMAAKFGIEAASKVLINEIKQVFHAYGINVDYRHLSLIADYMTFEGVYRPFNRIGIKANASPLQKMSFETCLQFFKDAYLLNQHEDLKSPSARLVTGRMLNVGSGLCELLTKLVI